MPSTATSTLVSLQTTTVVGEKPCSSVRHVACSDSGIAASGVIVATPPDPEHARPPSDWAFALPLASDFENSKRTTSSALLPSGATQTPRATSTCCPSTADSP